MPRANPNSNSEAYGELLRNAGLRITAMRLEILRMLAGSPVAMSAADVLDALSSTVFGKSGGVEPFRAKASSAGDKKPTLRDAADAKSLSRRKEPAVDKVTVYRTLNTLVDANLAHRIDPGDRVFRYSLTDHAHCTDDHHNHEHPHMICERCGAVECIEDAEVVIRPRAMGHGDSGHKDKGVHATPAKLRRFRVTRQEITLRGTCERCDRSVSA